MLTPSEFFPVRLGWWWVIMIVEDPNLLWTSKGRCMLPTNGFHLEKVKKTVLDLFILPQLYVYPWSWNPWALTSTFGLRIWIREIFLVHPFCGSFEPRFTFRLCHSHLDGVKSTHLVVLSPRYILLAVKFLFAFINSKSSDSNAVVEFVSYDFSFL